MTNSHSAWIALLIAISSRSALAQDCPRPERGSRELQAAVDSIVRGHRAATMRAESTVTVALRSGSRCVVAVGAGWNVPHGGRLAIVGPAGKVEFADDYPDLTSVQPVGDGRIGFYYTAGWGEGETDSHYVVLCSFGTEAWVECLSVPAFHEGYITTRDQAHVTLLGFRFSSVIQAADNDVTVHRRAEWRVGSTDEWRSLDLGTVTFRLP